jgi:hypothetical protein
VRLSETRDEKKEERNGREKRRVERATERETERETLNPWGFIGHQTGLYSNKVHLKSTASMIMCASLCTMNIISYLNVLTKSTNLPRPLCYDAPHTLSAGRASL